MSYRIVILKAKAQGLKQAEQFLRNRQWQIIVATNLRDAIAAVIQKQPEFVLIAADHPNRKARVLPKLIGQAFPVKVVGFVEASTNASMALLHEMGLEYNVFPPVSGPAIERTILKIKKDEEKKELDRQRAIENGTYIPEGGDATTTVSGEGAAGFSSARELLARLANGDEDGGAGEGFVAGGSAAADGNVAPVGGAAPAEGAMVPGTAATTGAGSPSPDASGIPGPGHDRGAAESDGAWETIGPGTGAPTAAEGSAIPGGAASGPDDEPGAAEGHGTWGTIGPGDGTPAAAATGTDGLASPRSTGGTDDPAVPRLPVGAGTDGLPAPRTAGGTDGPSAPGPSSLSADLAALMPGASGGGTAGGPGNGLSNPYASSWDTLGDGATAGGGDTPAAASGGGSRARKEAPVMEHAPIDLRKNRKQPTYKQDPAHYPDRDSIIVKGTQAALDEAVLVTEDAGYTEVQAATNVACITIASPRFSGYLVAALGADRRIDADFLKTVRDRLFSFLRANGEALSEEDGMQLQLEQVDFEEWAIAQANFLRKSVHGADEIAMAFFPSKDTEVRLEQSVSENMLKLGIDELHDDVPVEFDLYIYLPTNKKYLLYTPQGRKLFGSQKGRLRDKGVTHMHLRKDAAGQVKRYRAQAYLNDMIGQFKRDPAKKKAA